jgi:hypothetical protein
LAATLPNSYFVGVTRNPRMVVQSLILARQQVQGSKSRSWGLYSRVNRSQNDPLGYVDDVCQQVIESRARLQRARTMMGAERYLEIDYDAFCLDPRNAVMRVASFVPQTRVMEQRIAQELRPFRPSNQCRLTADETQRIEQVLPS